MNKEYIYLDGRVVIIDESQNKKQIEYKENLDELLVQENLVETIENKINELKIKIKNKKSDIKINKYFKHICMLIASGALTCLAFTLVGLNLIGLILGLITIFTYGIIYYPFAISVEKNTLRKYQSYTAQLEKLIDMYDIEKVKLENMKSIDQEAKPIEQGFKTVKVDDKKVLQDLKETLILYYTIGNYEKRLSKFYQKGILRDKLEKKSYWSDKIEIVEDYFVKKIKH